MEIYDSINRVKAEGQNKIYVVYNNIISIIEQVVSIISISTITLKWSSYIFLLIFVVPIIATIINTRIGYLNYKMRMGEVRKTYYINYLITNDIAFKDAKTYNIGEYLSNMHKK